jgi:hypothetical protein
MPQVDAATGEIKEAKTLREGFAMIPTSLIESDLGDGEFRTYCAIVNIQGAPGEKDYDAFGQQYLADRLGRKTDTIKNHVEELERRGIIAITREGQDKKHFKVLHNPAWVDKPEGGRQTHLVEDVDLSPPKLKYGATAKARRAAGAKVPVRTDEHRAKRNADDRKRRLATAESKASGEPSVCPDERDTVSPSAGHTPPVSGTDVSLSAGRLLHLRTGSEWVSVPGTSRVEASGTGTGNAVASEAVHESPHVPDHVAPVVVDDDAKPALTPDVPEVPAGAQSRGTPTIGATRTPCTICQGGHSERNCPLPVLATPIAAIVRPD